MSSKKSTKQKILIHRKWDPSQSIQFPQTYQGSSRTIAVKTRKIIHAEIGEHHGEEAENGEKGDPSALPAAHRAQVEQCGINQPGDQGPGLFGIPAPVAAPGGIGPDRTGDDTGGQPEKTEDDHLVGDFIQHLQGGEMLQQAVAALFFKLFKQIHQADTECDGKGGITDKAGHHMGDEPIALQRGEKGHEPLADSRVQGCIGHGEKSQGGGEGAEDPCLIPDLEKQVHQDDGPGKKHQRFIEVGKGRMTDPLLVRLHPPPYQTAGISDNTGDGNPCCHLTGKLFFKHPGCDIQSCGKGIYEGDDR